jgi:hypothetical protein
MADCQSRGSIPDGAGRSSLSLGKPSGHLRQGQGSLLQSLLERDRQSGAHCRREAANGVVTERQRRREADALLAQCGDTRRMGDLPPASGRSGKKSLTRLTHGRATGSLGDHGGTSSGRGL